MVAVLVLRVKAFGKSMQTQMIDSAVSFLHLLFTLIAVCHSLSILKHLTTFQDTTCI